MAKKKEALTPEQRLQEALVPCTEWPYQLPENWCWTYIRSGYDITSSKRVHKNDWLSEGIPFYRTRELVKLSTQGFVDNELFISEDMYETFKKNYGVPEQGDLLISGVGTIGVPYVVDSDKKFYFKDGNIIWFKSKGLFLPQYTYYLYKSQFIDNQIHDMSAGTTVDTYTIINANSTKVPLAPLPEQQRIVDRIESLFAQLDEAKEKAQAALDSFEPRKAAILHKAFTGELTAKWREEHGLCNDTCKSLPLLQVCKLRSGTTIPAQDELESGEIPYVKVSDMNLPENSVKITTSSRFVNDCALSHVIPLGSTIFPKRGGAILTNKKRFVDVDMITADLNIMAIIPHAGIANEWYCYYWMLSIDLRELNNGSNVPQINNKDMEKLFVPVPKLDEQLEIVRLLDSLLSKEQQAKEAAEEVLEQIDLTKKSILSRAFRGELGTNDSTEESAVELLKEILG